MPSEEGQLLPHSKRNMEARVTLFLRVSLPSQGTWECCAVIHQEEAWERNLRVVGCVWR